MTSTMFRSVLLAAIVILVALGALSVSPSSAVAQEGSFCGGIAGFPCPEGYICVDDPRDNCDPAAGGADCAGICQAEDVCQGQSGAAAGLCTAYCEAMACDTADPNATPQACEKVLDRFRQAAGAYPPCCAKDYISFDVQQCASIRWICAQGAVFSDDTGCGCAVNCGL